MAEKEWLSEPAERGALSQVTQAADRCPLRRGGLVLLAERLRRHPRHLGLHNGGMIVTGDPIANIVPVEPATMDNRTVVQFDREQLEELGIVKIDLLGLRMLSVIADTIKAVKQVRGVPIDL